MFNLARAIYVRYDMNDESLFLKVYDTENERNEAALVEIVVKLLVQRTSLIA